MGLYITKIIETFNIFASSKPTKIVMLGLDGSGKTTILNQMKLREYISTIPTIGFNVETVEYKKLKMTIWDLAGQAKLRRLWKHYFQGSDAIIFVIDSSDKERMEIVKEEMYGVLNDMDLMGANVLIFANKQDIGVMTPEDITNKLELHTLKRPWKVIGTCAATGAGIIEGLEWLSQEMKKK